MLQGDLCNWQIFCDLDGQPYQTCTNTWSVHTNLGLIYLQSPIIVPSVLSLSLRHMYPFLGSSLCSFAYNTSLTVSLTHFLIDLTIGFTIQLCTNQGLSTEDKQHTEWGLQRLMQCWVATFFSVEQGGQASMGFLFPVPTCWVHWRYVQWGPSLSVLLCKLYNLWQSWSKLRGYTV